MFTAKHIKGLMDANPFIPFKIRMSNGKTYDVPNHDAAFVSQNIVEVGTDMNSDNIPRHIVQCSILHIAEIEKAQAF